MEPRMYQFYNTNSRAISPTFSNWSPMVPNPLDAHHDRAMSEEERFPAIKRSFAFDEWDDDDSEEAQSYISSIHNGGSEEHKSQPEVLAAVPRIEYGHTIYDATQVHFAPPPPLNSKNGRPTLDTYMTVVDLDDILKTSSSTDTEISTNNHDYKHSIQEPFVCQSIPRRSMTYRWTSATPTASTQPPVLPHHDMHNDEDNHSCSTASEPPCPPIPEYVTVYKSE